MGILLQIMLFLIGVPILIIIIVYMFKHGNIVDEEEKRTNNVTFGEVENNDDDIKVSVPVNQTRLEDGLVKRMRFSVVGLNYEGRRNILKRIINKYKREDAFYEKYEGMTNKEIIEDYFDDRVYELYAESLNSCIIEKEDDNKYDSNALKITVEDYEGNYHHIGYVPREHCVEIRKLMNGYRMVVGNTITGGKYKEVDYDEEKVVIKEKDYGLQISVSFWEE